MFPYTKPQDLSWKTTFSTTTSVISVISINIKSIKSIVINFLRRVVLFSFLFIVQLYLIGHLKSYLSISLTIENVRLDY